MALALTYKVDSATAIDLSHVYLSTVEGLTTCANQGVVGTSKITVPDKGGLLDTLLAYRRFHAHESASPDANRRLYSAWTTNRRYNRGKFLTGRNRMIDVGLVDMNNFLSTKIIRDVTVAGTPPVDYTGDRPAETDLERIAWLLASPFINLIDDYGLVSTTGAVDMDAHNYTDGYASDVLRDCALKSGKNFFAYNDEISADAERFGLFYDFNHADVFNSTLSLTDVPGEADGDLVFDVYPDIDADVDPSQLISAINVLYGTGLRLFRRDTDIGLDTANNYYSREVNSSAPWIKTATKAGEYADRNLLENSTEDPVATVRVLLPKEKVGLIRAGHRIHGHFEFFPQTPVDLTDTYWRIIEQTIALDLGSEEQPKPVDFYNMTLKMVPIASLFVCATTLEPGTPAGYYPPLYGLPAYSSPAPPYVAIPEVHYLNAGVPRPFVPDPDHSTNNWGFPQFHIIDGGAPGGFIDTAWSNADNHVRCLVIGPGTMTIHLREGPEAGTRAFHSVLQYLDGVVEETIETQDGTVVNGVPLVYTIPESVLGENNVEFCAFWVDIRFDGSPGARDIGFGGFDWAPA